MDVPVIVVPRAAAGRIARAGLLLIAALLAAPAAAFAADAFTAASDVTVKAAFLYNFAKFTEWPALAAGAPILFCVVGDDGVAGALVETVRGQNISGHALEIWRPQESVTWHMCHLLFITEAETRRSAAGLDGIKLLPVLTVGDGKGFADAAGIIELYVEGGRMRFAINADAADAAGLHLSSRLLGLARVVRSPHVQ